MKEIRLETTDGLPVCERCLVADTFWTRFRGFMGRPEPAPGDGILFEPGGSVHMFFMRYPLDVVFCDRELRVVGIAPGLRPWRLAATRGAKVTIELATGEAGRRGLEVGARLTRVAPD
jgi:uncharacterized protein